MKSIRLGVNVDHVATLRQARRGRWPDPVEAALVAASSGADSIVCHLREDRRHIQDRDVRELRRRLRVPLNLEMALAPEIVEFALRLRPDQVTLVPERRRELTTEGGLDVRGGRDRIAREVERLHRRGIAVSLFINPDLRQVEAATQVGARIVEIHTGRYAEAADGRRRRELAEIAAAVRAARRAGLAAAAGHGLDYDNVALVAALMEVEELNIGYSIIGRALFTGLSRAVREMKRRMNAARR